MERTLVFAIMDDAVVWETLSQFFKSELYLDVLLINDG